MGYISLYSLLITFSVLSLIPVSVKCCTCTDKYRHFQDIFCRSPFLIKGEVTNATIRGSIIYQDENTIRYGLDAVRVYTVKIKRIFKRSERISGKTEIKVRTPLESGLCGVPLKIGDTYLFRRFRFGTCSYGPWNFKHYGTKLTVRRIIRQLNNCRCQVKQCHSTLGNCVEGGNRDWCAFDADMKRSNHCYDNYGVCKKGRDRKCQWRMTKSLTGCLNMDEEYMKIGKFATLRKAGM